MSRIFISYRRDDTSGYAGRLNDRLKAVFGEDSVFMDLEGIDPGVDFVRAIDEAIRSCHAVIVLIGPEWLSVRDAAGNRRLDNPEDFPRLELKHALQRDRIVLPVLVHDAAMPSPDDLPEDLKPMARINAIDLSDERWDYDFRRLVERLRALLAAAERMRVCPSCGLQNLPDHNFCGSCGAALGRPLARAGVPVPRRPAYMVGAAMALMLLISAGALAVAARAAPPTGPATAPPIPLVGSLSPDQALRCAVTVCAYIPAGTWQAGPYAPATVCFQPKANDERHYLLCVGSGSNNAKADIDTLVGNWVKDSQTASDRQNVKVCAEKTADTVLGLSGLETSVCFTQILSTGAYPARTTLFIALNQAGDLAYYMTWTARAAYASDLLSDPGAARILNSVVWK